MIILLVGWLGAKWRYGYLWALYYIHDQTLDDVIDKPTEACINPNAQGDGQCLLKVKICSFVEKTSFLQSSQLEWQENSNAD